MAALLALCLLPACPAGGGGAPAFPERIVSLAPTGTEILCALGLRDRLVGRCRWCDYPADVQALPAVGDATSVDVERLLVLHPDLVLVGSGPQAEALAPVGSSMRIERVDADRIEGVRRAVLRIAEITGREAAGRRLVGEMDAALTAAARRHPAGEGPTVLFAVQHEPLLVAGKDSYVGELLVAIGARNVAGDVRGAWPALPLETLVAKGPDVILDASLDPEGEPGAVGGFWARFTTVPAVKNGRVVPMSSEAVVRPGPRLGKALGDLEALVYGEKR